MPSDDTAESYELEVEQIRKGPLTQRHHRELREIQWTVFGGTAVGALLIAFGIALALSYFDIGSSSLLPPALDRLVHKVPLIAWSIILCVLGGIVAFVSFSWLLDLEAKAYQAQLSYLSQVLGVAKRHDLDVPDWLLHVLERDAVLVRFSSADASK